MLLQIDSNDLNNVPMFLRFLMQHDLLNLDKKLQFLEYMFGVCVYMCI